VIRHIDERLVAWAAWAESRVSGALGYPKASAFTRLGPGGGQFDGVVVIDEQAWATEQAVLALSIDLRAVAIAVYRVRGTRSRQAALLVCSERTLDRRIGALHEAVRDWLFGYYAGRGDGQGERHLRRAVSHCQAGAGSGAPGAREAVGR
jgi:hypothetical protein